MIFNRETEIFIRDYVKDLNEGTAAIFAGAGLSIPAGFVNWRELMSEIAFDLGLDINVESDLVSLAQFHVNENRTRSKISRKILEEFVEKTVETENHRILARLPISSVWTTNYDELIEKAFLAEGKVSDTRDFVAQTLRQQVRSSPMSEVAPSPKRYKTTNWPQYNAALKARGSLTLWLDSDMQWLAAPSGKRGRQHLFSDACIQFCLSMKCLFGLPLRQTLGLVQSLLQLSGAHWPVPDYSTVSRRQKSLTVELNYQRSGEGLHLLVDSTGIKFLGEGEWKCKKHGPEYRRQWRKVHLGIDAQTLEIRAIEVTDNSIGDAPMLPCLLEQIAEQEDLLSVSADGVYDTKACHEAIAQRGAQAIIPPRKNAKWWKEGKSAGAKVRNEAVKACQRLGHRLWKQWSGYHRRSLVETKMHCFKRLGERVMARTFERQVVELQVRVALLNRFTQLGRPVTVPVA